MAIKITHQEWQQGAPGAMYGLFDVVAKRYMFNIVEQTPMLAIARLFQRLGDDAKLRRFRVQRLPRDMVRRFTDSILNGAADRFGEFDDADMLN